jgi:hypothetical protein
LISKFNLISCSGSISRSLYLKKPEDPRHFTFLLFSIIARDNKKWNTIRRAMLLRQEQRISGFTIPLTLLIGGALNDKVATMVGPTY